MAVALSEIVSYLDRELSTAEIADYPGAMNGLQLANSGHVTRIVAAVDASLPVIEAAAAGGPGLLVVHHGLFWQGAQPITGALYRKLKCAMEADLAIYSSHLPLDIHPLWGNNVRLAEEIGLLEPEGFFDYKGIRLGIRGRWEGGRDSLADRIAKAVGGAVHLCPAGPKSPRSVGIITGGAGSEVAKVAAAGVDTFVTGEGPHWSYPLAEELNINVFYAGHYATETFGVKTLSAVLAGRWGLPHDFVHRPTGL